MRKVFAYDLSGNFKREYDGITVAADSMGFDESSIRKAAKREGRSGNFYWSFIIHNNILNDRKYKDSHCTGNSKPCTTKKLPKILIIDIETAPMKAYVWQLWKQDIYIDQIISDWFILSWSAKWLFSDSVMSERLTGDEARSENDERIIRKLWNVLDEADILVAHNGNAFDIPKINTRFLKNGLGPTSYYQQIDTCSIAKKQFGFSSNKLDFLARQFGIGAKHDTDFSLWVSCVNGDDEALRYMETYNRQDVVLLEEVYLKLRPWVKYHPNLALYMDSDNEVCPNCGSEDVRQDGKFYYTPTGKYPTYVCKCGARSRGRKTVYNKEKGKNLITSINK